MKDLAKQHEVAKRNAIEFMKKGQITAYLSALVQVNNYKRLMVAVAAN